MLVSLTVGKVDAGVAVLLTEDKRLIEFPSILLPPDIHSGSIVDINVSRNQHAELDAEQKFSTLQSEIFNTFGSRSPSPPVLRCRNATQTSIVLEWDPVELATAELRSLSLYRNGAKAGVIPKDKLSTKISGLALDTEYNFQLVLRTSAGQYASEKIVIRTHKMTDLTGITITPGVMAPQLKESLAETVNKIGAKLIDTVRIDTTHFVCTEPRGQAWEKAVEMNVPVVVPDWLKGCEREGRIVGVRGYYLDADPKLRQIGPLPVQQQAQQPRGSVSSVIAREGPRIEHTPPTPDQVRSNTNASFAAAEPPTPPPKHRGDAPSSAASAESLPSPQAVPAGVSRTEPAPANHADDDDDDDDSDDDSDDTSRNASQRRPQATSRPPNRADGDESFDEVAL